ncbi:MAG: winged helix-turn-helix domain-containing protein [Chloroflexi bacterium]|nr:winged helix-turn-helix domain-containing protein [Chloroflexota bacterium]MBI3040599.1 winged helix-turn-helix domain-containing protein [Chloroflexota bacterium]
MPTARHFRPEAEANFHSIPSAEPGDIRRRLAEVLLQYAGSDKARRPGISQREMAVILDTSWDMVSSSLKSLQAEGAIRIDRHRMVINKKALERIAVEMIKAKAYALLGTLKGGSKWHYRESMVN